MGLIEIVLTTACFLNSTCYDEGVVWDNFDNITETEILYQAPTTTRKEELMQLMDRLKYENLVVTTLKNDRLSGVSQENNTLVGTGVAFDLLKILQKKFQFNYTIVLPKRNRWVSDTDDGIFNMLKNKKADVSVAFLPILTEYADDINFSPSLDTGEWVVLMKRPKESASGSGLLAPFTLPVWLLILLSLVVVGPVIYLIIYIQAKLCNNEHNKIFPLPACIWFVYGALLKQGTTLNPMTDSSRLLFSTWWIFITILTAFYTANLTAFLTLSKFTLPINEPKDIGVKKTKWVTTKGNTLQDTIRNNGTLSDLGRLLGEPIYYLDPPDRNILKTHVTKRDMMFIREKPIVEYVMYDDYKEKTKNKIKEEDRCTYVITKFSVVTHPRAFAYSKDFAYQKLFDNTIQHLVESGIIKYKLREELPDTEICPLNLGNKERQLRNSDLLMTYEIVGGGFIISLIIFIIELLIRQFKDPQKRHAKLSFLKDFKLKKTPKHTFQININNNYEKFGHLPFTTKFLTPPPAYNTLFIPPINNEHIKKKNINGREYWVYDSLGGEKKMVPLRTPSALLFQYTN